MGKAIANEHSRTITAGYDSGEGKTVGEDDARALRQLAVEFAMPTNLLVAVIGTRNSGKTTTWNTLFGRTVKTGREMRPLEVAPNEWVDVFLVSGSPEERDEYVGDLITVENPRIVLCSLQYKADVWDSFRYFFERDYSAIVHWLNPGYNDYSVQAADTMGLVHHLLHARTVVGIRNGQNDPKERVEELRQYVRGWAGARGLIYRRDE